MSDDAFILIKNQLIESPGGSWHPSVSNGPTDVLVATPKEVVERMSAADPYFQASSDTVNPFTRLKLPARSQLVVQEGGRCCHSLPDASSLLPPPTSITQSSTQLTASDSSLCPSSSPLPPHQCHCHHEVSSYRPSCHCTRHQCSKCSCGNNLLLSGTNNHCSNHSGNGSPWHKDHNHSGSNCHHFHHHHHHHHHIHHCPSSSHVEEDSGNSPRSDIGGNTAVAHLAGAVRRRGSGESGFFSVDDVERIGTPELCLSYSELSSASLMSTEDEDVLIGHHCLVQRSSSVITDSSEDLSSLGCCHDHYNCCELSSLPDPDDASRLLDTDCNTDIKSIVEFFERGYGSVRTSNSTAEAHQRKIGVMVHRKERVVPMLRNKFSLGSTTTSSGQRSSFVSGRYTQSINTLSPAAQVFSKSIGTKDYTSKSSTSNSPYCNRISQPCMTTGARLDRQDTYKLKDRPKVYITEGTVRAKRDIFEAK